MEPKNLCHNMFVPSSNLLDMLVTRAAFHPVTPPAKLPMLFLITNLRVEF
jgi:hypothetical protein